MESKGSLRVSGWAIALGILVGLQGIRLVYTATKAVDTVASSPAPSFRTVAEPGTPCESADRGKQPSRHQPLWKGRGWTLEPAEDGKFVDQETWVAYEWFDAAHTPCWDIELT